jgi:methyl-accepting chemotaxis protein
VRKRSSFRRFLQAITSADLAEREAGEAQTKADQAKATIATVTDQVNKQLGNAAEVSRSMQDLSKRISELEKTVSQQMNASSERVDSRVAELDDRSRP